MFLCTGKYIYKENVITAWIILRDIYSIQTLHLRADVVHFWGGGVGGGCCDGGCKRYRTLEVQTLVCV